MAVFDLAIDNVLKHEGGYVNDPDDPGGETIYGISRRSHPEAWADGRPSREDAIRIYREDYWQKFGLDEVLFQNVANKIFDMVVHMRPKPPIRVVQKSVNDLRERKMLMVDGIFGPMTLSEVNNLNPFLLVQRMCYRQAQHYGNLAAVSPDFLKFLPGWLIRAGFTG